MEIEQNNNNTQLTTDEIKNDIAIKRLAANDEGPVEAKKMNKNGNAVIVDKPAQPTPGSSTQSPKKRLQLYSDTDNRFKRPRKKDDDTCIYGNYRCYYSKRTADNNFCDIRLDIIGTKPELFRGKELLDIGCNSGELSIEIAKCFQVKSLVGLDIDRNLADIAQNSINILKNKIPHADVDALKENGVFPFNVKFIHGNYVLDDDVLLEKERPQFDVILCLSVTKWIHLNFCDAGLKQAFRRIFLQLRPGGTLILEPQSFKTYKRRKYLNDTIKQNFDSIRFRPVEFKKYLLGPEVGFASYSSLGIPNHTKGGFNRPIEIYTKAL